MRKLIAILLISLCLLVFMPHIPAYSSTPTPIARDTSRRAVDMMLVIDNSCSMFPKEKIPSDRCSSFGNDPFYRRITGGDLFITRLGFSETNASEYQLGIISMGNSIPDIPVHLQPLDTSRDALAKAISDPKPADQTQLLPALDAAYNELRTSPNRRPSNRKAVVLITDGRPYPEVGQTEKDIKDFIDKNSDIPLFVMLLQDSGDPEFEKYKLLWQDIDRKHTNVMTYDIKNEDQIAETYNSIMSKIQGTEPTPGIEVAPGKPLSIFVPQFTRKIILTVIHSPDAVKSDISITDPKRNPVNMGDDGVSNFRGDINPVQAISIAAPRLSNDLKGDIWTIQSDQKVLVFFDLQGVYKITIQAPTASLTDISDVYLVADRQKPDSDMKVRFNLVNTDDSSVVSVKQQIAAGVIKPDGTTSTLSIPSDIAPDATGTYTIQLNPTNIFPDKGGVGRFTLILKAGSTAGSGTSTPALPISTVQLQFDTDKGPSIQKIEPSTPICQPGRPTQLQITVGDAELAVPDTLRVRVFGGATEIDLTQVAPGQFQNDIAPICEKALASLRCATSVGIPIRLRLVAQMKDGSVLPAVERSINAQVHAPGCTPPPEPTSTKPNGDGGKKPWTPLEWGLAVGAGLLGLFLLIVGVPLIRVLINKPPVGYITVARGGQRNTPAKSIYSAGMQGRAPRVKIGGDKKRDHIYVEGLKSGEFIVERQDDKTVITDIQKGIKVATLHDRIQHITTSRADTTLLVSLKP